VKVEEPIEVIRGVSLDCKQMEQTERMWEEKQQVVTSNKDRLQRQSRNTDIVVFA
jgi:hypothetical protein